MLVQVVLLEQPRLPGLWQEILNVARNMWPLGGMNNAQYSVKLSLLYILLAWFSFCMGQWQKLSSLFYLPTFFPFQFFARS
jgi:hypothetical protein